MNILFFSPNASTWDAALGEGLIIDALRRKGNQVKVITCGTFLKKYCIAMAARNLRHNASAESKARVCEQCVSNKKLLQSRFDFNAQDAEELLSFDDYKLGSELAASATRDNFLGIVLEGIPVGRFALYEVLIHNKRSSFNFNNEEWAHYLDALENTVLSLKAAQKSFEKYKPDRFVVFSSMYSINHVWKMEAIKRSILPYQIQNSATFSDIGLKFTLTLDDAKNGIAYFADAVHRWPEVSQLPCTKAQIDLVTRHFKYLFSGGTYVFSEKSKGRDVRKYFKISKSAPLFVATLSSYDEVIAAETVGYPSFGAKSAFSSQMEWVKNLITHFEEKPEWALIIRPHPRMYPFNGFGVLSEEAKNFQKIIRNLPKNIYVNAPDDRLSMYDVAQEADVILNAWSSVGSEMALLGVPVVQYLSLTWYPDDINVVADTPQDYFKKIKDALNTPLNISRIVAAYRWYRLIFDFGTIDFSAAFPLRGTDLKTKVKRQIALPGLVIRRLKALIGLRSSEVTTIFESAELQKGTLNAHKTELVNEIIIKGLSSSIPIQFENAKKNMSVLDIENELNEIKKSLRLLTKISSGGRETRIVKRLSSFLSRKGAKAQFAPIQENEAENG